jgi:hypothetical protein
MDAKEVSAIMFFAEAVAAAPSQAIELADRARKAAKVSDSFEEVLSFTEALHNPKSIDDIIINLKPESRSGLAVFLWALRAIRQRHLDNLPP